MKATDLLERQHKQVRALFKKATKTESPEERRSLCEEIVAELEAHARIEEEFFYPAIRDLGTKKAEELFFEAIEEHHAVKLLLRELPELDPDDERFDAKVTVLMEMVEHHVEEEEEELFELAEKLGDEELEELGVEMEAEFDQLRAEGAGASGGGESGAGGGSRAGRFEGEGRFAQERGTESGGGRRGASSGKSGGRSSSGSRSSRSSGSSGSSRRGNDRGNSEGRSSSD